MTPTEVDLALGSAGGWYIWQQSPWLFFFMITYLIHARGEDDNGVQSYNLRSLNVFVNSFITYGKGYEFNSWVLVYSKNSCYYSLRSMHVFLGFLMTCERRYMQVVNKLR